MEDISAKARYIKYYFMASIGIAAVTMVAWIVLSLLNCKPEITTGFGGIEMPTIKPLECLFSVTQIPNATFIWAISMVVAGVLVTLVYKLKQM